MEMSIRQELVVGILLILGSILLFIETLSFTSGAGVFPQMILYIIIFLSILLIFSSVKKRKKLLENNEEVVYEGEEEELTVNLLKSPFVSLVLIGLYVLGITFIGFFTSTILYIVLFMRYMGVKNWKSYVISVVGFNLFIYFLFVLQLNVRLPAGILF